MTESYGVTYQRPYAIGPPVFDLFAHIPQLIRHYWGGVAKVDNSADTTHINLNCTLISLLFQAYLVEPEALCYW